jgi:DNA repair protein RadC
MDERYRFHVRELPPALRPRERLLSRGPSGLTSAELLAILLGSGTQRQGVLRTADRVVRKYGLQRLAALGYREWLSNHGIGPARACQLLAAFELVRRCRDRMPADAVRITSPREAYAQVRELGRVRREHLVGLYLDAQNCLLHRETLSIGTLNTTRTHPREVLQPAIVHHALGFILVHNHPSGNLTPSQDDVGFTRAMRKAAEIMGIDLYAHLVVARSGFVSLREKGLL